MAQSTTQRPAALVTGASYGIGEATALALAQAGYDVAVTATRAGNLARVQGKLEGTGAKVVPLALDLRSQQSIEQCFTAAVNRLGKLDLLVNNAGTTVRKFAVDVTREEWAIVMEPNVEGTFFLTQQMGRHLIAEARPGSVVSVASTHGLIGAPERSTYGISKGAIAQMTRMLAVEWGPKGIRVNAVAPGRVLTESPMRQDTGTDPKYLEAMLARVPLKRFCTPEEVAAAVVYFAGPGAACVTGQILYLDGGLTVQ
jgi:NAD(P)-dependent dehydrogenase (short-subunit alcohol dehydrogenase family)